jgi:hypothetical protein
MDSASLAAVGFDPDLLRPDLRNMPSTGKTNTRHRPFTHGAKEVLKGSLRQTIARGDRTIGAEHLLLALLGVPSEDPVARIFAVLEADPVAIREQIDSALRRAS